ncbi:hypothetical protein [Paremcibacter congregatus]|uniref:Uncharacterized protein n=1 Tax=Paremcibacter congregatus TaxID=2043170 RepID=A0A2G4YR71_9PROT|nr:hypothetical protein [Paremcibacter congregatus]PHZ84815.1 hypothetical protein CRD36_08785 [Paremcibacter congregatus]QDE26211.1 hypothetical protein FIV45_02360 [Paremcibacter congregatus]
MTDEKKITLFEEVTTSLERMQNFDCNLLPRESDLGNLLNFANAVPPAKRLIELYNRLTTTALQDFPTQNLNSIKQQCDSDYQKFSQIIDFDLEANDLTQEMRKSWIGAIEEAYDKTFIILHPFISYSLHRSADFQRLDTESRAAFQKIQDNSAKIQEQLIQHKSEAESILQDIRNTAAEQGITQQAKYFKEESEGHNMSALTWETRTKWLSGIIGVYAIASVFIHKWDFITPHNTFDAVQLIVSKILIFSILVYLLTLSAKNYLNHRHNAVVNKHRQNALMTYKALVDASGDSGAKEAVLIQAASCIFNPQSTGYAASSESSTSGKSFVEIFSKPAIQSATSTST